MHAAKRWTELHTKRRRIMRKISECPIVDGHSVIPAHLNNQYMKIASEQGVLALTLRDAACTLLRHEGNEKEARAIEAQRMCPAFVIKLASAFGFEVAS